MKDPSLELPLKDRVGARLEADDLAGALKEADEALARQPRDVEALKLRAGLRALAKDWMGSVADLDAVLAVDPEAKLDGALIAAYSHAGELAKALAECERELRRSPDDATLFSQRSGVKLRTGDLAGARADLEQAARRDSSGYYWSELANLELEAGLRKEGIAHLEKAMEASPGDWRLRLLRGRLHLEDAEYQKAHGCLDTVEFDIVGLEACRDALELCYTSRAYARLFLGRPDAEDDVREALKLNPQNSDALTLRGTIRFRRGEDGAREDLEEALRLDPESYFAHASLGRYWLARGDGPKAREHFRRVIELNPEFGKELADTIARAEAA